MFQVRPEEVAVTDRVLGKGAFGEVRVAYWRSVSVAYKRPHIRMENEEKVDDENLQQEIEVLSKLRHPNLVLFIGVCRDRETSQLALLTELLPYSLYDILELQKIELSLPDIIDIALDIVCGLDYLHSHEPIIVHRDISSKNILISGHRAKIADLGQAKMSSSLANSTPSRQSKLPGAMAYAAPETLTGKYSSPIDIFSFGILWSQMMTNDYPRIDKREDQVQSAIEKYPLFSELLQATLQYQPHQRPTARIITTQLRHWQENDRYYPPTRHYLPENDFGFLAKHWMNEQMQQATNDWRQKWRQSEDMVQIEQQRWQLEAQKVDQLQQEYLQFQLISQNHSQTIEGLLKEKAENSLHSEQLTLQNQQLSTQLSQLQQSSSTSQIAYDTLQTDYQHLIEEHQQILKKMSDVQETATHQQNTYNTLRQHTQQQTIQLNLIQRQLEMQITYSKDLESRLEQTLVRWQQEYNNQQTTSKTVSKYQIQYNATIKLLEQSEHERELLQNRLNIYEGLPLPVS
jgi:serine/threonine protein kinase